MDLLIYSVYMQKNDWVWNWDSPLINSRVSFSERLTFDYLLFYLIPSATFVYFAAQGSLGKEVQKKTEDSFLAALQIKILTLMTIKSFEVLACFAEICVSDEV